LFLYDSYSGEFEPGFVNAFNYPSDGNSIDLSFLSRNNVNKLHVDGTLQFEANLDSYDYLTSVAVFGSGIENTGEIPQTFTLSNAYPNPFNPSTTITLSVIQPTKIRLSVFDVLGRNVPQLHTAESLFGSGEHQLSMDFSGLPSGLYFIEANGINLSNGNIEKSVLKVSLVK
jgi:hypothetical protein